MLPRTGEFEDAQRWEPVETRLHRTLREAARAAGLAEEALIKYEASATRQEILRDDSTRIHPLLTPWEHLNEDHRDRGRSICRSWPTLLAGGGNELFRLSDADGIAE